jgi:hypothetical protein
METLRIEAERLKKMGSPLSVDQLIAFLEKKEAKKAKNQKNIAKGFEKREAAAKMESTPLWGPGAKFSTQAEYQRSCLGSKFN